jgi:hypothetical protein
MNLETYGVFLVGSILASFGIVVLGVAFLFLNHLYSKYWHTVQIFKIYNYEVAPTEPVEPVANTEIKKA